MHVCSLFAAVNARLAILYYARPSHLRMSYIYHQWNGIRREVGHAHPRESANPINCSKTISSSALSNPSILLRVIFASDSHGGCRRQQAMLGFGVVVVDECHAHTCVIRFAIA